MQSLTLNKQFLILINHWVDNSKYQMHYGELSKKISDEFGIESKLIEIDYRNLLNAETFEIVEQKIIKGLVDDLIKDKISYQETSDIINKRQNKYWYSSYENIYLALKYANEIINLIKVTDLNIGSLEEGIEQVC